MNDLDKTNSAAELVGYAQLIARIDVLGGTPVTFKVLKSRPTGETGTLSWDEVAIDD